jgi:PAS domain S-box-containing protein
MDVYQQSDSSVPVDTVLTWAAPLNRVSESVVIYDIDGTIRFWNDSSEALYGWGRADVVGKQLSEIGWPAAEVSPFGGPKEYYSSWRGTLQRRHKSGENMEVALRIETMTLGDHDREPVTVEYAKAVGLDAIGGNGWHCSCTLVSPLLSLEADQAMSGPSAYDAKSKGDILRSLTVSSVNETASVFFGGSSNASELIGRSFHSICPDAYREIFTALLDQILINGQAHAEGVYSGVRVHISRKADEAGCLRLELSGQWPQPNRVWQLQASEERYRMLVENMPIAMWEVDASRMKNVFLQLMEGGVADLREYLTANEELVDYANENVVITSVNDLAAPLFGATDAEEMHGPVSYIFSEARDAAINVMVARFHGQKNHAQEMKVRTFDGRLIDVLFMVSYPHRSAVLDKTLLMMVDITDRIRLEKQLKKVEADFAHASRVSALGEMVSSIAHEIRQPLTIITTDAETSLRWLSRVEPPMEKVRKLTERIAESAERANSIIGRIKEMAVKQPPTSLDVELNDIVIQSMSLVKSELRSRSVKVISRLTPNLPTVVGDGIQFQQVVVNLLMNAVDAIDAGASKSREIVVETKGTLTSVDLVVSDSGPGIPSGFEDKIFDSFYSTKESGMGMGLAICRSIAVTHGGSILARNSPQGGARITLSLPAATQTAGGNSVR